MSKRPQSNRLNWKEGGYSRFAKEASYGGAIDEEDELWNDFRVIFERAMLGDFSLTRRLLALYDQTESWILGRAYVDLLGDSGTDSLFRDVLAVLDAQIDPTYQVHLCEAVAQWGSLLAVPRLLQSWAVFSEFDDAAMIPVLISRLLEEEPGSVFGEHDHNELDKYTSKVMSETERVANAAGSSAAIVWHGELINIEKVVKHMLKAIVGGTFEPWLRRKFEAYTGVDCTTFYRDEVFQPLAACKVLETFLETGSVASFQAGVRYFFGHRIPA